jgi:hypothetical protein
VRTYQSKAVSFSGTGDKTIVPAVTGKHIRVRSGVLTAKDGAAFQLTVKSSGGTVIAGPLPVGPGFLIPLDEMGHFETPVGEGLVFNVTDVPGGTTASGAYAGGWVTYWETEG